VEHPLASIKAMLGPEGPEDILLPDLSSAVSMTYVGAEVAGALGGRA